jgi:branched-chain amino acid transport system ATP-binding protein
MPGVEGLAVEGLVVRYGGVTAVRGIDLTVGDGQSVGIVGANGAGKSSVLKAVGGLVRPAGGTVTWNGVRIDGRPPHQLARLGVVAVPEGRAVFGSLTVLENLWTAAFARRGGTDRVRRAVDDVLSLFPALAGRTGQRAGSLSGGEQQMLAIGRALAMDPELLVIDELSLGLAPLVVAEIYEVLRRKHEEGLTLLLVEQHLPFLLAAADDVYVLRRGEVVEHGAPGSLAADLGASYLGAAR